MLVLVEGKAALDCLLLLKILDHLLVADAETYLKLLRTETEKFPLYPLYQKRTRVN